jgi:hypothetical protein
MEPARVTARAGAYRMLLIAAELIGAMRSAVGLFAGETGAVGTMTGEP